MQFEDEMLQEKPKEVSLLDSHKQFVDIIGMKQPFVKLAEARAKRFEKTVCD